MLNRDEIRQRSLVVYIHVGENKEGTPQFRKVRWPESVDVAAGKMNMWVEDFYLDLEGDNLELAVVDPENPPSPPRQIEVESSLRNFEGHIILFDSNGKKIDETPIPE